MNRIFNILLWMAVYALYFAITSVMLLHLYERNI